MKKLLGISCFVLLSGVAWSQTYQWSWKGGVKTFNQTPVWGTKGLAVAGNSPGARKYSITWTTPDGYCWLWGGMKGSVLYSDLWRFDPASGLWAWLNGPTNANAPGVYGAFQMTSPGAYPGARRDAVSWIDDAGNLWLFGGQGHASVDADVEPGKQEGYLNDVWKYIPSQNQWIWMAGSKRANEIRLLGSNAGGEPGGRSGCTAWKANDGTFYLFGGGWGAGLSAPDIYYNDMWRFDLTKNRWFWVWGDPPQKNYGEYGSLGVDVPCTGRATDPCNMPPRQTNATGWTDTEGNLWFFGGEPQGNALFSQYATHLWRYNIATKRWTWMGGQPATVKTKIEGQYGTKGVASKDNLPMARSGAVTWTDTQGNFWLFGGNVLGYFGNDVWKYNSRTQEWTWIAGTNLAENLEPLAVFGTLNVMAPGNQPGARVGAASWVDRNGNLWIFGGEGLNDVPNKQGYLSDIWMMDATIAAPPPPPTPPTTPVPPTNPVTAVEPDPASGIQLYPNPAGDETIFIEGLPSPATVEVINSAGMLIWKQQAGPNAQLPAHAWAPGLYGVRIRYGKAHYLLRFVRQ